MPWQKCQTSNCPIITKHKSGYCSLCRTPKKEQNKPINQPKPQPLNITPKPLEYDKPPTPKHKGQPYIDIYKIIRSIHMRSMENYPILQRYINTKIRAGKKNLPHTLTLEDHKRLAKQPCAYCKDPIPITYQGIGLDRVDNTKGYTPENTVPCCFTCNRSKYTMTLEDFINHINKIYNNLHYRP